MKPRPLEDEKQREAHPDDIGIHFDGQKVASDSQWWNCRLSGTEGTNVSTQSMTVIMMVSSLFIRVLLP
jgi:hypothetical protein